MWSKLVDRKNMEELMEMLDLKKTLDRMGKREWSTMVWTCD